MAYNQNINMGIHFDTSIIMKVSFLLFTFVALTDGAEDLCQYSKYNEDNEILEASKQKLSPLVGKIYTSKDDNGYQYTIGICTTVENGMSKTDLAVLQEGLDDNGSPKADDQHDIGSLKDTHIMTGSDWIILEYRADEVYGTHCGQEPKRTSIVITCDANTEDNYAKMVFVEEDNQKADSCYYLFEMKHQAVCATPVASGLSVGSIFLIVFFSVVACYLFVGFLYARFVLGSKGKEQIPNYEFWKDFGNLQADGCDFVCRTKERSRAGGFGGIGDDQLDPTEDIIRDENLLPM